MTKPSYEELESQLARALADSYNNKRDNEILAELSQILVGYREGSHDLLRERAEVLAEAEDNLEAAETELARVRGLLQRSRESLQRILSVAKSTEKLALFQAMDEAEKGLCALAKESGAESADIGKLDTVDKKSDV